MKALKFKKICNKINFWTSLCLILIMFGIGSYAISSYQNYIKELSDYAMIEQVKDMELLLNSEKNALQSKVDMALKVAHNIFYNSGELVESEVKLTYTAINQISKNKSEVSVNQWLSNGSVIQNDYDIVDEIKGQSVETATIFQKIPDGYLRISTNVMNNEGERAVGTFIPNDSPVIKTVESGQVFHGRAYVVNQWYYTAYEPIIIDGEIKGILYVGVPDVLIANLKQVFKEKQYFKTGYPYVVDKDGNFLIHPSKEGANVKDYDFFKQMDGFTQDITKQQYLWEGKSKYQFFKFYEPLQAYISITIYQKDLYSTSNAIRNIAFVLMVIGIIVFIMINKFIVNKIIKSLKQGINITKDIAEGHLNNQIEDVNTEDEVSDFVKSLKTMNSRLSEVVYGIRQDAERVSEASQQLSTDAEMLSQNATEQASSVEEISTSIEEMNANLSNSTSNARLTQDFSVETMTGLENIKEASKKSMDSVMQITSKIEVINDIAGQTNILALNAAVEAARAGDHGKGFAVVAIEVRNLAEKSKIAADEIFKLSNRSKTDTQNAFDLLSKILPKIEKTNLMIMEISSACIEQKQGIGQINDSIGQLNDVTQTNAASSEEMAGSAEMLSDLGQSLSELVSFFDTSDFNEKDIIRSNKSQGNKSLANYN